MYKKKKSKFVYIELIIDDNRIHEQSATSHIRCVRKEYPLTRSILPKNLTTNNEEIMFKKIKNKKTWVYVKG